MHVRIQSYWKTVFPWGKLLGMIYEIKVFLEYIKAGAAEGKVTFPCA